MAVAAAVAVAVAVALALAVVDADTDALPEAVPLDDDAAADDDERDCAGFEKMVRTMVQLISIAGLISFKRTNERRKHHRLVSRS